MRIGVNSDISILKKAKALDSKRDVDVCPPPDAPDPWRLANVYHFISMLYVEIRRFELLELVAGG